MSDRAASARMATTNWPRRLLRNNLGRLALITALVFAGMSAAQPALFLTRANFSSMAFQFPEFALLGLAVMVSMLISDSRRGTRLNLVERANEARGSCPRLSVGVGKSELCVTRASTCQFLGEISCSLRRLRRDCGSGRVSRGTAKQIHQRSGPAGRRRHQAVSGG